VAVAVERRVAAQDELAVGGQPAVVPPLAIGGGLAAAVGIGVVAGLYPSLRAARLSPTEALRTV